jgi:hypothetical protein
MHAVDMAIRLLWSLNDHAEPRLGMSGLQPGYKTRKLRIGIAAKQTTASRIRIGLTMIRQSKARGVAGNTVVRGGRVDD